MISRGSLRSRLLIFGGGLIAIALTIAWLVLGFLFERHLERQYQVELERHGLSLIAALTLAPDGRPQLRARPFDPRFNRPAGGLYWRISAPAGALTSRSLWDGVLPRSPLPPQRGWGVSVGKGPYEREVVMLTRDIRLEAGSPPISIQVAGDRGPIHNAGTRFGFETGVFLAVLWAVLALAAWVQARLGLAPLEQIRREVATLRMRPGARLAHGEGPEEIDPLTTAVNELLDARAVDLERAQKRARDLAHALKTPLTALRLQIDRLDHDHRAELADTLALVAGTVEGELARALEAGRPSAVHASPVVIRLWSVIARTPEGGRLHIQNRLSASFSLPLSEEAALELLGALLENAARFAESRVVVEAAHGLAGKSLTIDDDGPGIAPHLRDEALQRGRRLDEKGGRHGLGLAIALDRVQASGGRLELGVSPQGGLRVALTWPNMAS